ncbi:hypothetical protein CDAR_605651 [Caerostris darwini]|uniref:Uncharacterized protein n=1 Tax=Caerostris darwini TaxID=1538125 RepID=A0AAV4V920_9ARAC|nr:hypothetical protein CDAR_605651 [Caerostris darwini]
MNTKYNQSILQKQPHIYINCKLDTDRHPKSIDFFWKSVGVLFSGKVGMWPLDLISDKGSRVSGGILRGTLDLRDLGLKLYKPVQIEISHIYTRAAAGLEEECMRLLCKPPVLHSYQFGVVQYL